MNSIEIIVEFLNRYQLSTIALVVSKGSDEDRKFVYKDIKDKTGIDLRSIKETDWSPSDIEKLITYEQEHFRELSSRLACTLTTTVTTQTQTIQKSSNSKSMMLVYWFGIALALAAILYMIMITWIPIPENNIRFADTSLGFILGSMLSTIIQYFFGTSMRKTDFHSVSDIKRTSDDNKKHS